MLKCRSNFIFKIQMKKTILIVLITIYSAILSPISSANNVTILSVGDSITSGLKLNGDRSFWFCPANGVVTSSFQLCNGNGVRNQGGFQPDIASLFAQRNINANVYNWGFAGEETWQVYFRVVDAMETRPADYVFILAGVNDLNDNVAPQTTAFYVTLMIDAVLEKGLIPIVGTITPHLGSSTYNPKIELINSFIRFEAGNRKVAVAEHYQALISNWGPYNSGDGLHVSDLGDAVIAAKWLEAYDVSQTLRNVTITPILQLLLD